MTRLKLVTCIVSDILLKEFYIHTSLLCCNVTWVGKGEARAWQGGGCSLYAQFRNDINNMGCTMTRDGFVLRLHLLSALHVWRGMGGCSPLHAIPMLDCVSRGFWWLLLPGRRVLTLIPTAVTIYGLHYFKAKFLKKSLNNIKLRKIAYP
jgi:hypothetical protein